jgi:hypothetical protein
MSQVNGVLQHANSRADAVRETRAWLERHPEDRAKFETTYARHRAEWAQVVGPTPSMPPMPIDELPAGESSVVAAH